MFMKYLLKRNSEEISSYLLDKRIECFELNFIQHHPTTENIGTDIRHLASLIQKTKKCLKQHCAVV